MKVTTAAELQQMTPSQRDAHLDSSIEPDLDSLPAHFVEKIRSRLAKRVTASEPVE